MASNATHDSVDDEAPGPPISVPDSGDTGEGGKLKMIVQLVKKCLGVKDIAAMRLSLPASLLEPIPNLEYWHYLDRPDIFAAINDSHDPFERMLAVLRFTFTKDLKFVHGKVCKPYNSVLGEHFRAHWDFVPVAYPQEPSQPPTPRIYTVTVGSASTTDPTSLLSETASVKSGKSSKSTRSGLSFVSKARKSPSTAATSPQPSPEADGVTAQMSSLNLANGDGEASRLRVVYVTEQVSHHPPVSAYFASCPARSLELSGIDQISAKVSGTTLRVSPGEYNQGLFVNITGGPGEGERYHITHPVASVNGILRGSFYVTVGDSTIITCTGGNHAQKFRTVIEYKEESWLGKAHFLLEGVIHTVHEGETQHLAWTKVKHVPHHRVVAVFDGSWRGHIRWRRVGLGSYPQVTSSASSSPSPSHETLPRASISSAAASKAEIVSHDEDYATLLDLSTLKVVPKSVRPLEKQLPHESRKLWVSVTDNLLKKEYSEATKEKVAIEQKQRDEAADRKRKGTEFVPRYFEKDIEKGYAALTAEGWAAVQEELNEESSFCIEGSESAQLSS
ncbi:Oxysterol-binding protein-like protein 1 [Hypsizygus marmoreus]|uniref:Oxysterol-binding protein-like protein 1 n=1 Tax=Hypsizygus marmoreus TaxID=39966 RepID=A0A369K6U7_HYPMA|nr:Oxysterol-binding protein-like protein 1 [Hypsizygus marmoreus]